MSMMQRVSRLLSGAEGQPARDRAPVLSCVVIVHDMMDQAENTVKSLLCDYQRDIRPQEYEVIIVENASPRAMRQDFIKSLPGNFHYYLRENAEPSPGPAINFGVARTSGENICILIDGARMLTPGALKHIILGLGLGDSAVVSVPGYHIGHQLQQEAAASGWDSEHEHHLLQSIAWPQDGYRLFEISCMNASSALGFFLPNSESNCISLSRQLWNELGGYDTRFNLRGGGLINLDFYKRACEHPGIKHVILPGEGTFHQFHGGVTTGGQDTAARSAYIEASNEQYRQIRGEDYENPRTTPIFLGEIHQQAQRFLLHSVQMAMQMDSSECHGKPC